MPPPSLITTAGRLALSALVALAALCVVGVILVLLLLRAIAPDSGKGLKNVADGQLAPPGSVLVSQRAIPENFFGGPAHYQRVYGGGGPAGVVQAFYRQQLEARGWQSMPSWMPFGEPEDGEQLIFEKGDLRIRISGANGATISDGVHPSFIVDLGKKEGAE